MGARAPTRRRVAHYQGSRGGVGIGWDGRAKSFWEKGMRDEMSVSPAIWLGYGAANAWEARDGRVSAANRRSCPGRRQRRTGWETPGKVDGWKLARLSFLIPDLVRSSPISALERAEWQYG